MNVNIDLKHRRLIRPVNESIPGYVTKAASRTWEKVVVLLAVVGVLLPSSPYNMPLTYRDSGVFLYIGWRILNGELPYRDIWDHKPPIVYYLNALGLAISNSTRWGIWLVEASAVLVAAAVGFKLIEKSLGRLPALFATLLWLSTLVFVIEGGNLTEEYALPLQIASLWLIYNYEKSPQKYYLLFLIGLFTGLAFFTKQTTIGVSIAIVIYLFVRRSTQGQAKLLLRETSLIAAGSLVVTILVFAFFSLQGALQQFWSAAFIFNFAYIFSTTGAGSRFASLVDGIRPLAQVGLLQLSLIGYFLCFLWVIRRKEFPKASKALFSVALIAVPLELILVNLPGHLRPHYYISILPVLSMLAAFTCWIILNHLPGQARLFFSLVAGGLIILILSPWYAQNMTTNRQLDYSGLTEYIRNSTSPDQTVLLWGAEAAKNYFIQRRAPTRYVYLNPLYQPNFVDEHMIGEFLGALAQNQPKLIIYTKNPRTPLWEFPVESAACQEMIQSIRSQYREKEEIGRWTVYELIGEK